MGKLLTSSWEGPPRPRPGRRSGKRDWASHQPHHPTAIATVSVLERDGGSAPLLGNRPVVLTRTSWLRTVPNLGPARTDFRSCQHIRRSVSTTRRRQVLGRDHDGQTRDRPRPAVAPGDCPRRARHDPAAACTGMGSPQSQGLLHQSQGLLHQSQGLLHQSQGRLHRYAPTQRPPRAPPPQTPPAHIDSGRAGTSSRCPRSCWTPLPRNP